jgi:hypothetical protein
MANVVISNKLPQTVSITVLDAQGTPTELRLDANKSSEPMPQERLTPHVHQLAERGHVRVRAV